MSRRYSRRGQVDWASWIKSFGAAGLGFVAVLIAFYFTTKDTLNRHEHNFVEIGKKFDGFSGQLQKNYDDWAKVNKADQEKADRIREQFLATFTTLSTASAAVKVQVDNVATQLDKVTTKLDAIQNTQQRDRPRDRDRDYDDDRRGR